MSAQFVCINIIVTGDEILRDHLVILLPWRLTIAVISVLTPQPHIVLIGYTDLTKNTLDWFQKF